MVECYIIMGGRNTKKSATIRALTGIRDEGVWKVATQSGEIDIYVKVASLQESEITPKEFIEKVEQSGCEHVLTSLWIWGQSPGLEIHGKDYIEEFVKAGWTIKSIVVLGDSKLPYNLPQNAPDPDIFIPDSYDKPANWIASQIRSIWHWL